MPRPDYAHDEIPAETTEMISYRCDKCAKPIKAGEGYIHVSYRELGEHDEAHKAWKAKYDGQQLLSRAELMELPDLVPWQTHHRKCDPHRESVDYWFDVGRADSYETLLSWTAHLLGKSWITDTNWSSFLYAHISHKAASA